MFALQFAAYGRPEVLAIAEWDEPHAGPGQLRIAARATGITPADGYLRSGSLKDFAPLDLPHIPGMDAAGIVDEIGEGVTGVVIGDAVFGYTAPATAGGAAAQYVVLEAWAHKPDALSWEQAGGAAANVETATRVLNALRVTAGSTLLIEGAAGGVGTTTIQLAVARGATVVGTASTRNHDLLAQLGAVPTTYGPGLADRVAQLAPDGVDAVLDAAGSGSLPELVRIAGDPARVISIADFNAAAHGVRLSYTNGPGGSPSSGSEGLLVAAALAVTGAFTVPLDRVFPLTDAHEAHQLIETGHAKGKVVLTIGQQPQAPL